MVKSLLQAGIWMRVSNMNPIDVTATLTDIILTSISQKSNLLDSFVITYATIVASLYRLIGIEFGKQIWVKLKQHRIPTCDL